MQPCQGCRFLPRTMRGWYPRLWGSTPSGLGRTNSTPPGCPRAEPGPHHLLQPGQGRGGRSAPHRGAPGRNPARIVSSNPVRVGADDPHPTGVPPGGTRPASSLPTRSGSGRTTRTPPGCPRAEPGPHHLLQPGQGRGGRPAPHRGAPGRNPALINSFNPVRVGADDPHPTGVPLGGTLPSSSLPTRSELGRMTRTPPGCPRAEPGPHHLLQPGHGWGG